MICIIIEKGKNLICVRFVDLGGFDCIKEHNDLIEKNGYVWFAKIGNKPAMKVMQNMLDDKTPYLLLKDPRNAYIAEFSEFSEDKPLEGEYPEYYKTEIPPSRKISVWFKITSIKKVEDLNLLNNIVLISSRSPILETTKKSMASHFFTVARCDIEI